MNRLFQLGSALAVLATLGIAAPAAANDRDDDDDREERWEARHCDHPAAPVYSTPAATGHYETRYVSQWVETRADTQWVAGRCSLTEHRHGWRRFSREICEPGHYQQTVIPGHYEQVASQVWVADAAPTYRTPGSWQYAAR